MKVGHFLRAEAVLKYSISLALGVKALVPVGLKEIFALNRPRDIIFEVYILAYWPASMRYLVIFFVDEDCDLGRRFICSQS